MGLEEVGMLDTRSWGIPHLHVVRTEFREVVISALRERAAAASHASAKFVEDLQPKWEQTCSAN